MNSNFLYVLFIIAQVKNLKNEGFLAFWNILSLPVLSSYTKIQLYTLLVRGLSFSRPARPQHTCVGMACFPFPSALGQAWPAVLAAKLMRGAGWGSPLCCWYSRPCSFQHTSKVMEWGNPGPRIPPQPASRAKLGLTENLPAQALSHMPPSPLQMVLPV